MVTDLFRPFVDDLSQHTQGDLQSSFGSCDTYPFGDTDLFYENFQPLSTPDLDEYEYMAITKQSKTHTTEQQCFQLGALRKDLQMKKQHILDVAKESLGPEVVPYLVSSSLGNHKVSLGSLIFSQPLGSSDILSEDEDDVVYTW
jgi:hypothetical protein